jgi:hypothetical protein
LRSLKTDALLKSTKYAKARGSGVGMTDVGTNVETGVGVGTSLVADQ